MENGNGGRTISTVIGLFIGLGGLGYGMQSQTHERIDQLENRVEEQTGSLRQVHSMEARFFEVDTQFKNLDERAHELDLRFGQRIDRADAMLQREVKSLDRLVHVELANQERHAKELDIKLQQEMKAMQNLMESEMRKLDEKLKIEFGGKLNGG